MTGLATEYGEGLYELAREEHLLDELHGELTEIARLLEEQPDFSRLLCSRAVERDARLDVVQQTFGDKAHPFIVNFIKLLVEKERFGCFLDCVKWYHQRYNDDMRIVEASVTSAVPLSDNDIEALRQKLEQISGRRVHAVAHVDPSIIGGIRVEMDGRQYDNTIQNRLDRLKYNLTHNL